MFLFEMEGEGVRRARLANMAQRVLHRLGDSAEAIWTTDEIESYVRLGVKELADRCRIVWDQIYLENLPAGFSYTAKFERSFAVFDYGRGGYTFEEEAETADEDGLIEMDEMRRAFHTSPSEIAMLEDVDASTDIPATSDLPPTLTDIDRATWDKSLIDATNHARVSRMDSRYETTEGEVIAYIWQREGPNTLRKVRVPNEMAETVDVIGSWGIVRDIGDVSDEDVDGSWGIPRRIPSWHPMGWSEGWGTPRRFYLDEKNVKLEHWRQPYVESMRESELPEQYFRYITDYAQWRALTRNGPGQDYKHAQLYQNRWLRNIERIVRRIERQQNERIHRMGGAMPVAVGPPRPRLPWQYGQRVR